MHPLHRACSVTCWRARTRWTLCAAPVSAVLICAGYARIRMMTIRGPNHSHNCSVRWYLADQKGRRFAAMDMRRAAVYKVVHNERSIILTDWTVSLISAPKAALAVVVSGLASTLRRAGTRPSPPSATREKAYLPALADLGTINPLSLSHVVGSVSRFCSNSQLDSAPVLKRPVAASCVSCSPARRSRPPSERATYGPRAAKAPPSRDYSL